MHLNRWSIRSLRRFKDLEMLTNIYLATGGTLSLLYALCAVLRTRLYEHIFSMDVINHSSVVAQVSLQLILQSVLRTVLWLPQILYGTLVQHQSLWDWITAAQILKDLS